MGMYVHGSAVSCSAALLAKAQSGLLYSLYVVGCWVHCCCWLLCMLYNAILMCCNLVKQASPLPHACTEIDSTSGLKFVICVMLMGMLHSECILTRFKVKTDENRNQETAALLLPEPASYSAVFIAEAHVKDAFTGVPMHSAHLLSEDLIVAAKNLLMYVDILFWQSAHQKLPRSDSANQINCALVSSKIVCVGDAAQVGATRASLAGWSCHFHLLCCRYAIPFLLSDSALVPLTFRLLQLPFNLPFSLHFSLPFSLPFSPPFSLPFELTLLPAARCLLLRLLPFGFFVFASTASRQSSLTIMYMQGLLQPLLLPSSIATQAHASPLPWQHRSHLSPSSISYSLSEATICLPSNQPISTDNHAFCRTVYPPIASPVLCVSSSTQLTKTLGQTDQHELQHL